MLPESDEEEWEDDKADKADDSEEDESDSDKEEGKNKQDDEDAEEESDENGEAGDEDDGGDSNEDDSNGKTDERDPLTGTWSAEIKAEGIPAEQRNIIFSLELADDGTVTGSADTPDGEKEISNGKFDADTGKLTFEVEDDDETVTVEATVKENEMTGKVNMGGMEIAFRGDPRGRFGGIRRRKEKQEGETAEDRV